MQVRRWAEQVLLCKANRTDWNATEHKRAWSGMGEGTRAFCFLGDGVTAEVLLISAQRKAFLSQVPLPCLPSSLLFTLEDQTFGTVHRREMFTTELCPALTHPPTMTSNTDSFSSENILHNITFKYSTIIIILYNVLKSRGADINGRSNPSKV